MFYLPHIGNLGDFLNCMPVMSGLNKKFGKYDFIVTHKLKQFKGFHEFMMYQDLFTSVTFDDEVNPNDMMVVNPWNAREEKGNPNRPLETCRFENNLKDRWNINFEVDDDFVLKVPDLNFYCGSLPIVADRWTSPAIDTRRPTEVLRSSGKFDNCQWLDYNNDLLTNSYIIKNTSNVMYTTFTGVSVLGDLLNKEMIVFWGDDIKNWDNKPIEYSYQKHFYGNRNSKLMYIGDWLTREQF